MDFSDALRELKAGKRVQRAIWAEVPYAAGGWLELAELTAPDGREVMPLLLVEGSDGMLRPFGGTNWDLLSDDWELYEE